MIKGKNNEIVTELEDLSVVLEGLVKLGSPVKQDIVNIDTDNKSEIKFIIDSYYQVQQLRITTAAQLREIRKNNKKDINSALEWVFNNVKNQELQIKKMIDIYTDNDEVCKWIKKVVGVGPILAASLTTTFDINKVNNYNQFWSYAGLNDYNNPWLGVTKADKLVSEIYKELSEQDVTLNKVVLEYCSEINTTYNKFTKNLKSLLKIVSKIENYRYDEGSILNIIQEKDPDLYNRFTSIYEDPDYISDFIIRNFISNNYCTNLVLYKVQIKTTRRLNNIINGLNTSMEFSKSKYYSKTELEKYLAKPPYNVNAKQIAYLLGESFVKVSNNSSSLYGRLYKERKAYELEKNEKLDYADQAKQILQEKSYGKDTESYKYYIQGKLPPAQIHRRAKRYAVRIFLSHLFEAMYIYKYNKSPNEIYPIAYLNHKDYIQPEVPFDDLWDK